VAFDRRAHGEQIQGGERGRVGDRDGALRVAAAAGGASPGTAGPLCSSPTPSAGPDGKSLEVNRARPMSTRQLNRPVMLARIGPAAV